MKKFFSEFKKFICRGNIIDMAIGVIVGGAFSAIVKAFSDKIIMPFINYLLSLGGSGLEAAYTFLKRAYVEGTGELDLANSIYIDWGAFITAVIDFLIIALTLFIIIKVAMKSRELIKNATEKALKASPSKAEKVELKAQGVNMKNRREVLEATKELRAKKAEEEAKRIAAEEEAKRLAEEQKPTTEKLLAEILAELRKENK